MYCMKCGSQMPENVEFCPKCGTKISTAKQTGYDFKGLAERNKARQARLFMLGVPLLLVIIILMMMEHWK